MQHHRLFLLLMICFVSGLAAPAEARAHRVRLPSRHTPAPEATVAAPAVSPNLVSRWPGDGNARDVVSSHDGVPLGGVKFAPGVIKEAFSFNGSGAFVDIPFSINFDFAPGDRFTVAAWVQPQALGKYQALVVKATVGGDWDWGILLDPRNHFYTGHTAHDIAVSQTVVKPGVWYHVAVTYDNGAWVMYVNGVQEAQASGVPLSQSLGGLAFGHKGGQPAQTGDPDWFGGLLDDVHLYNRALTADEVKLLSQRREVL